MRKKETPIIPWMIENRFALQEIPIIRQDALLQGRLEQELARQRQQPQEPPKDDTALLKDAWYLVVGEETARNARPLHFFRGVLHIRVRNPIWLQELNLHRGRLIQDLNQEVDGQPVRDLKLELGPLPPLPASPETQKPVWQQRELTPAMLDEIEERLAHLPNNDLKASARRIMTQHFKRTRLA